MTNALTGYEARGRIAMMRPGARMIWFRGYLPWARLAHLCDDAKRAKEVNELANTMLRAGLPPAFQYSPDEPPIAGLGLGELSQRRRGDFDYEYWFTKY